jgi:hypothetical protein
VMSHCLSRTSDCVTGQRSGMSSKNFLLFEVAGMW